MNNGGIDMKKNDEKELLKLEKQTQKLREKVELARALSSLKKSLDEANLTKAEIDSIKELVKQTVDEKKEKEKQEKAKKTVAKI